MFIKGKVVALRATEPADADTLYAWENNTEIWPVSNSQIPFSKFILEEFLNSAHQDIYTNKQLRLMIAQLSNNETLGVIDLFEFDPQHARCGLGIYVHQQFRERGIANESVELIKNYVFDVLHLKQVYVHVNATNKNSLLLFEKNGFEKNGLKKHWHRTGLNTFEDVWFMQCYNPIA